MIRNPAPFSPAFCRRALKGIAICAAVFTVLATFRSTVVDWDQVPSGSMSPTILEGDRICESKLAYDLKVPFTRVRLFSWSNPERGDIVVFHSPTTGRPLIKRVIAVPGDAVACDELHGILPAGKYFVMGDNRSNSYDSRFFGPVDRSQIVGKAMGVIASFDSSHHDRPRWNRFFSPL